jgi:SPP1 family predicted phage head-tail adaptor
MLSHRLRHRITVQELSEIQDTNTGALTYSWETAILDDGTILDAVPAEVLTGAGREFVQSGATQGQIAARINMRWFPGLTQKMRIVWDTNIYNITSIETDITGRQEYRLKCVAGVSDGQ